MGWPSPTIGYGTAAAAHDTMRMMLVAFSAGTILFPTPTARLSSILIVSAFVSIAVKRHEWKPVLACVAWAFGFEAVLDTTYLVLGKHDALGHFHTIFYVVLGIVLIPWITRRGVTPDWRLLTPALIVYIAWCASGFHVNGHHMTDFSPAAEVFNEVSKSLWGFAYLVPLLNRRDRVDALASTEAAPESDSRPAAA